MKVDIKHVEKSKGMLSRKTLHGVALSVTFSDEELSIIRDRRLDHDIIVERGVPADVDEYKHANRGMTRKLMTAAVNGRDANHFHLTVGKLVRGTDTYFFDTPLEAKEYTEHLREALPKFKAYIMENAGIDEKSSSFEL